jgi:hypothetical protein
MFGQVIFPTISGEIMALVGANLQKKMNRMLKLIKVKIVKN